MVAHANHTQPGPRDPAVRSITEALSAPFDPREIKFKPQMVKNNRALAIAYINVRLIEDRLDEVLGVENWQDEYEILADGSVACRLRLKLGGEWVTKMDVGSPSEQPDLGDRLKAAFSDALKRTARTAASSAPAVRPEGRCGRRERSPRGCWASNRASHL